MVRILILLFLVGCSGLDKCYEVGGIDGRERCRAANKTSSFYTGTGWRYYERERL